MKVKITTFQNPFSFYCVSEDAVTKKSYDRLRRNVFQIEHLLPNKCDFASVTHGQYVAVFHNDCWVRGKVSMETHLRIWLVDFGKYIRPDDKTIFVSLPAAEKIEPSEIFEASIHGCVPLKKEISIETCEVTNNISTVWCTSAIDRAKHLITNAEKISFIPIALLSTKVNNIVLGNLYLSIRGLGVVNLREELENWPMFLKIDPVAYIANINKLYTTHSQHQPSIKNLPLPVITPNITITEYNTICALTSELDVSDCEQTVPEGSTITYLDLETPCLKKILYKPSPEEIEKYSCSFITIAGKEHNVLNLLLNKAKDLGICELYADQKKGLGRANSRHGLHVY